MKRRGRYGVDAPYAPAGMAAGLAVCLAAIAVAHVRQLWITATILAVLLACYLHTTLRGKFASWSALLDGLPLHGDEQLLDVGCGRGAVLMMAARRLPRGRATGIDLWCRRDQSGNAQAATERNAAREGIADRVVLRTGDMRALPFADASFDVVVSSLAIHNIDATGRDRAIDEAYRVLRPGGRLLIADIRHARRYRDRLQALGAQVRPVRSLGWRMWWGGPWAPTRLVEATRPPPCG